MGILLDRLNLVFTAIFAAELAVNAFAHWFRSVLPPIPTRHPTRLLPASGAYSSFLLPPSLRSSSSPSISLRFSSLLLCPGCSGSNLPIDTSRHPSHPRAHFCPSLLSFPCHPLSISIIPLIQFSLLSGGCSLPAPASAVCCQHVVLAGHPHRRGLSHFRRHQRPAHRRRARPAGPARDSVLSPPPPLPASLRRRLLASLSCRP